MNIVKQLAKSIEGTSRNITTDNFFTSTQLAEDMLNKQITMVGTIRQNKSAIPNEMKPSLSREVHSSLFAFRKKYHNGELRTKKKKAVILISSMHHDRAIDNNNPKKKPDMILFYNSTKGGVDQMDQKV